MSFFCLSIFRFLSDNPAIRNRLSVYERDLSRRGFALLRREIDCLRRGFLSFCGGVSRSRARLTRKNSHFSVCAALRAEQSSRSRLRLAKMRFCRALLHFFGCSVTLPHFTFLPRQKHFTFARKIYSHIARSYPRKNFTLYTYLCRTGAVKCARKSDAFACRFGRREVQFVVIEKWCGEVT